MKQRKRKKIIKKMDNKAKFVCLAFFFYISLSFFH